MGCQKTIAQRIREQQGDYVLALKGSHGDLFDDVRTYFDAMGNTPTSDNSRYTDTVDKGHGRIETRQYWVIDDIQ